MALFSLCHSSCTSLLKGLLFPSRFQQEEAIRITHKPTYSRYAAWVRKKKKESVLLKTTGIRGLVVIATQPGRCWLTEHGNLFKSMNRNKFQDMQGCCWTSFSFTLHWLTWCWKAEDVARPRRLSQGRALEPISSTFFLIQVEMAFPSLATEKFITKKEKYLFPWSNRSLGRKAPTPAPSAPPLVRTLPQLTSGQNIFRLQQKNSIFSVVRMNRFFFLLGPKAHSRKSVKTSRGFKHLIFLFIKHFEKCWHQPALYFALGDRSVLEILGRETLKTKLNRISARRSWDCFRTLVIWLMTPNCPVLKV